MLRYYIRAIIDYLIGGPSRYSDGALVDLYRFFAIRIVRRDLKEDVAGLVYWSDDRLLLAKIEWEMAERGFFPLYTKEQVKAHILKRVPLPRPKKQRKDAPRRHAHLVFQH